MKSFYFLLLLLPFFGFSQSDTLNQKDDQGKRQGYWIFYGKDYPEKGYPAEGRIEEGTYLNDRKEGQWIKYYNDGVTPKLIFHYSNNRPSGTYEKRFHNGDVKESGTFIRNRYFGPRLIYFENGVIQSSSIFDSLGKEVDSTFYNFMNGCRELVIYFSNPGIPSHSVRYKPDSCNVPITVEYFETKIKPIVYPIEPSVKPEINKGGTTWIIYKLLIRGDQYFIEEMSFSTKSDEEESAKREIPVRSIANEPKLIGYNKLINSNDEIFIDGEFKQGYFQNGKVYIYDKDGILLRVKVYKKGNYHSDGQL